MKSVIKGSYKAIVGARAGTCWKSEPERKQKVSAQQHCILEKVYVAHKQDDTRHGL